MDGGSSSILLLFTSMRVNPLRPPNVSGSAASRLLDRSSTDRFSISPISSGKVTMELFSRLRYDSLSCLAIAGDTVCTRLPDRSRSRRKREDRSPTTSSTSRSKHPPMLRLVKRLSFVSTGGMVSNWLYDSLTFRRFLSSASSSGRSARSFDRKSSSTRLGIFSLISSTRAASKVGRSMYDTLSFPSRVASCRRFAQVSSSSLPVILSHDRLDRESALRLF